MRDAVAAAPTTRVRRPAPTREELTSCWPQSTAASPRSRATSNRQYAVVWRCIQRYGIDAGAFRRTQGGRPRPARATKATPDAGRDAVLRQGRARPLWFGHPWVYANAHRSRRGRRRRRATSCRCAITTAASSAAASTTRARRSPCASARAPTSRRRRLLSRARSRAPRRCARAPRPAVASAPTSTAWSTARATTCPGWWSTSTATRRSCRSPRWASPRARAEIFDALEAELRRARRSSRSSPAGYAELEGFAAGSRVARGESRATRRRCVEDGIRWRSSRSPARRPACSSTSARRARASARWREGARVLDCYAYAGGFALAGGARRRRRRSPPSTARRARWRASTAHAAANGVAIEAVEADAFRYLETATPRVVRPGRHRPAQVRARAQGSRSRAQGLRAAERAGAAGAARRARSW